LDFGSIVLVGAELQALKESGQYVKKMTINDDKRFLQEEEAMKRLAKLEQNTKVVLGLHFFNHHC